MPRSALPAAVAACGSVSKSDSPPPEDECFFIIGIDKM